MMVFFHSIHFFCFFQLSSSFRENLIDCIFCKFLVTLPLFYMSWKSFRVGNTGNTGNIWYMEYWYMASWILNLSKYTTEFFSFRFLTCPKFEKKQKIRLKSWMFSLGITSDFVQISRKKIRQTRKKEG